MTCGRCLTPCDECVMDLTKNTSENLRKRAVDAPQHGSIAKSISSTMIGFDCQITYKWETRKTKKSNTKLELLVLL